MDHFTTQDELAFIRRLSHTNRFAFTQYAELVLNGWRTYDKHVEVERVEAKLRDLLNFFKREKVA